MDELPLFPVSGWEIGTIPTMNAVFIRPAFLAHQFQKVEEADPGRRYLFNAPQAREFLEALDLALRKLEEGAPPVSGEPKH